MAARSSPPKPDIEGALPGLPSFRERLPALAAMLTESERALDSLPAGGSYLCVWDRLYECVHALKGLTRLLPCPPDLGADIIELCETVGRAYMGDAAVRDPVATARVLGGLRESIAAGARLTLLNADLAGTYAFEASAAERLAAVPRPLHQMSDFVTKKAFEAVQLGLPMWIVEERMVLGDYMAWAKRFAAAVRPEKSPPPGTSQGLLALPPGDLLAGARGALGGALAAPHGLLIHCAPQLVSGDGSTIHAFGWAAGACPADTALESRLKSALPNAELKRLP